MKELLRRGRPSWQEPDPLVYLVVLLERGAPKIKLHRNCHWDPLLWVLFHDIAPVRPLPAWGAVPETPA